MTTLHVDRRTAQVAAETRRLWDDPRVWMMNCLAVEAVYAGMSRTEQAEARRGRDLVLAAFIAAW
jgi:hypothetical protein